MSLIPFFHCRSFQSLLLQEMAFTYIIATLLNFLVAALFIKRTILCLCHLTSEKLKTLSCLAVKFFSAQTVLMVLFFFENAPKAYLSFIEGRKICTRDYML